MVLPQSAHGAMDWSAVCDCGISFSYSFFFVFFCFFCIYFYMLKVHQEQDSLPMKRQKVKEYDKELSQSYTAD